MNQDSVEIHTFMNTNLIWWIRKNNNNNSNKNKEENMKLMRKVGSGSRVTKMGRE